MLYTYYNIPLPEVPFFQLVTGQSKNSEIIVGSCPDPGAAPCHGDQTACLTFLPCYVFVLILYYAKENTRKLQCCVVSLIWAVTRAKGCDVSVTCNVTCNITCNVTCNAWITFIATVTMMDVLYTPKVTFTTLLILIFAIFYQNLETKILQTIQIHDVNVAFYINGDSTLLKRNRYTVM